MSFYGSNLVFYFPPTSSSALQSCLRSPGISVVMDLWSGNRFCDDDEDYGWSGHIKLYDEQPRKTKDEKGNYNLTALKINYHSTLPHECDTFAAALNLVIPSSQRVLQYPVLVQSHQQGLASPGWQTEIDVIILLRHFLTRFSTWICSRPMEGGIGDNYKEPFSLYLTHSASSSTTHPKPLYICCPL